MVKENVIVAVAALHVFSENNFILQKRVSSLECLIMLRLSSQKCDIVYGSQFIFFSGLCNGNIKATCTATAHLQNT